MQGTKERNGSHFAPVAGGPDAPRESRQDRGREAQHHPTKRGTQQDQPPRWCRSAPKVASQAGTEAHKDRGNERKSRSKERERERAGAASPQAHKKGVPPPIGKEQAAFPLITNSRQKISKKSLGVDLKKFSEKFFVGMFRGKKNPLRFSTEGV